MSETRTALFSARAEVYAKGRPGYAKEFYNFLLNDLAVAGKTGADIGSGTGILTEVLLTAGCKVYAVEPNAQMREKAETWFAGNPNFVSIAALGEQTGLPENSLDFITAASSFHWLDGDRFRDECLRIAKPEAPVIVVFNHRDCENELSKAQYAVCKKHCPAFTSLAHGWTEAQPGLNRFFGPEVHFLTFPYPLYYDKETFVGRSLSSSYSITEGEKGYADYCSGLEGIFDAFEKNGILTVPNDTMVCWGRMGRKE